MSKDIEDIVERYGDYVIRAHFYESEIELTVREIYESFVDRLQRQVIGDVSSAIDRFPLRTD